MKTVKIISRVHSWAHHPMTTCVIWSKPISFISKKGIIVLCLRAAVKAELDDTCLQPSPSLWVSQLAHPECSAKVKASVAQILHLLVVGLSTSYCLVTKVS